MPNSQQLFAEFETLGEIEVNQRLEHKVYDDTTRAYALRWLNDKAIERAGAARGTGPRKQVTVHDLARRAQGMSNVALLLGLLAITAAFLAGGLAYRAQRDASAALEKTQVLAAAMTSPTPLAARTPPHRHRAP